MILCTYLDSVQFQNVRPGLSQSRGRGGRKVSQQTTRIGLEPSYENASEPREILIQHPAEDNPKIITHILNDQRG